MFKKLLALLLLMVVTTSLIAATKGPIKVASKFDTEGSLLGQIIVAVLEADGFKIIDKTELGPTNILRRAITTGQIDIYPEYTGNGGFLFKNTKPYWWKSFSVGYETVKELDYKANKIVWLTPAPANNTWAIAVRGDLARKEKLNTLEDMGRYVRQGGRIKLAGSEEFVHRPDALPSFQKAYGFTLTKDQLLILSGGNTVQTEKAAAQGTNGVNFTMAYGTDGALAALGLKVLEDTKEVQPVYAPAPIIREEILKKYPEIEKLLGRVFSTLDLKTLQSLNAKIALEGISARTVARNYLKSNNLLK